MRYFFFGLGGKEFFGQRGKKLIIKKKKKQSPAAVRRSDAFDSAVRRTDALDSRRTLTDGRDGLPVQVSKRWDIFFFCLVEEFLVNVKKKMN